MQQGRSQQQDRMRQRRRQSAEPSEQNGLACLPGRLEVRFALNVHGKHQGNRHDEFQKPSVHSETLWRLLPQRPTRERRVEHQASPGSGMMKEDGEGCWNPCAPQELVRAGSCRERKSTLLPSIADRCWHTTVDSSVPTEQSLPSSSWVTSTSGTNIPACKQNSALPSLFNKPKSCSRFSTTCQHRPGPLAQAAAASKSASALLEPRIAMIISENGSDSLRVSHQVIIPGNSSAKPVPAPPTLRSTLGSCSPCSPSAKKF